jgi:hypothetical protein
VKVAPFRIGDLLLCCHYSQIALVRGRDWWPLQADHSRPVDHSPIPIWQPPRRGVVWSAWDCWVWTDGRCGSFASAFPLGPGGGGGDFHHFHPLTRSEPPPDSLSGCQPMLCCNLQPTHCCPPPTAHNPLPTTYCPANPSRLSGSLK